MSKKKQSPRGVVALSDLPRWVKPIGINDGWFKFSVFYRDSVAIIEEYVFASMEAGVTLVARAWHMRRCAPILAPTTTIPPLVMVAAGIVSATIEVTLAERFKS